MSSAELIWPVLHHVVSCQSQSRLQIPDQQPVSLQAAAGGSSVCRNTWEVFVNSHKQMCGLSEQDGPITASSTSPRGFGAKTITAAIRGSCWWWGPLSSPLCQHVQANQIWGFWRRLIFILILFYAQMGILKEFSPPHCWPPNWSTHQTVHGGPANIRPVWSSQSISL